jgi:hypothetical protein
MNIQKGGCEKTEMKKMSSAMDNLNIAYEQYNKNKNEDNKDKLLKSIKTLLSSCHDMIEWIYAYTQNFTEQNTSLLCYMLTSSFIYKGIYMIHNIIKNEKKIFSDKDSIFIEYEKMYKRISNIFDDYQKLKPLLNITTLDKFIDDENSKNNKVTKTKYYLFNSLIFL